MLKKLILAGVVAVVALAALRGTSFLGYAKQEVDEARVWLDDQIPVEKKIEQMRTEVANLDRDIDHVKNNLATEIVDVKNLNNDVAKLRASVDTEHTALVKRGDEVKKATEYVSAGRVMIPIAEAKDRLQQDVRTHLTRKKQLANMEDSLARRERVKSVLEQQFATLIRQKEELKAEIDAVEAEYKSLQLQQMESKYQTDDTRLARVKESLAGLRKKLDVEREKLKLTPQVYETDAPAASAKSVDEIMAQLNESDADQIGQARE